MVEGVESTRPKHFQRVSARRTSTIHAFRAASLRDLQRRDAPNACAVCGARLGEASAAAEEDGSVDGSLAWRRGDATNLERVRQCEACATGLAFTMHRRFEDEDDGG